MSLELSTVGAMVWWGTSGTPTNPPAMLNTFMTSQNSEWSELANVNTAPAITANPSTIDASNIKDAVTRYIPGRIDPGGILSFTMNITSAATGNPFDQWENILTEYETGESNGECIWIAYVFPDLKNDSSYTVYRFPIIPLEIKGSPGISQNALATVEAPFMIVGVPQWYTTTAS